MALLRTRLMPAASNTMYIIQCAVGSSTEGSSLHSTQSHRRRQLVCVKLQSNGASTPRMRLNRRPPAYMHMMTYTTRIAATTRARVGDEEEGEAEADEVGGEEGDEEEAE